MILEPRKIGHVVMVLEGPLQGFCGVLTKLADGKATLELEGGWFLVAPEKTLTRILSSA
jgi:hypothetical protein